MIADGKGRSGRSPHSRNRLSLRTQIRDTLIRRGEIIDDPGNMRDRRVVDLIILLTSATQNPGRWQATGAFDRAKRSSINNRKR